MKKIIFLFLVSVNLFSQEFKINLQINNVKQNKGKIFIAVYNKAESYKKRNYSGIPLGCHIFFIFPLFLFYIF